MTRFSLGTVENRYNGFMGAEIQPLYPKLEQNIVRTVLRELQAGLKKLYGKDHPLILVYGSYARGEANVESDLDVLLIYPGEIKPGREIRRVGSILADLNIRYQVLISVLPVSENSYRESSGLFWKNLHREGIPIEAL